MSTLRILSEENVEKLVFPLQAQGKRALTEEEIEVLKANGNVCSPSGQWQNIRVCAEAGEFDPSLIRNCEFSGFVVLGILRKASLKYHDLELECGLYESYIKNCVIGDDCVVRNVKLLENYHIGERVILFNIQEMTCTCHSKFGNGILKKGESEANRIWIGVANENEGRAVLPFESMIPADAYLWSHYRDDKNLLQRFVEMTEYGNSGKTDSFGTVGNDTVIKNTNLLKDVKIGCH